MSYSDIASDLARRALASAIEGIDSGRLDSMRARVANRARGLFTLARLAVEDERSSVDDLMRGEIKLDRLVAVVDLETTGLTAGVHDITEIGVVLCDRHMNALIKEHVMVIPELRTDTAPGASAITRWGIEAGCDVDVWRAMGAIPLTDALLRIDPLLKGSTLCAHNVPFDASFLRFAFWQLREEMGDRLTSADTVLDDKWTRFSIDTKQLAWPALARGDVDSSGLAYLAQKLGIPHEPHCALSDAMACAELARIFLGGEL